MIRFILIQNRQGKTRLSKWFIPAEDKEKRGFESEEVFSEHGASQFRNYKVVYRRYAGLFFSFCIDVTDNELAYLEAVHFFVEVLDQYFGNVCELDLVFNFHKVYAILDEVFLAGEIQETSRPVVLYRISELEKGD